MRSAWPLLVRAFSLSLSLNLEPREAFWNPRRILPISVCFSWGVPAECFPFFRGLPEANSEVDCEGLARTEADADAEGSVTAESESDEGAARAEADSEVEGPAGAEADADVGWPAGGDRMDWDQFSRCEERFSCRYVTVSSSFIRWCFISQAEHGLREGVGVLNWQGITEVGVLARGGSAEGETNKQGAWLSSSNHKTSATQSRVEQPWTPA